MFNVGFHLGAGCGLCDLSSASLEALRASGVGGVSLEWDLVLDGTLAPLPGSDQKLGRLASIGAPARCLLTPPMSPDGADSLSRAVRAAGALGIGRVVCSVPDAFAPFAPPAMTEGAVRALAKAAGEAKRAGAALLVLPRRGDSLRKLARAVRQAGDIALGLCLDTGDAHLSGSVLEQAALAQGALSQLYLADHAGGDPARLQPGYGNVPWVGLGRALAGRGIPLYVRAPFFGGASARTVLAETLALLEGRVYTRPDGGGIGRSPQTERILLR